MSRRRARCAALLAIATSGSASAQPVRGCITAPAAEALMLSIAPQALRRVGEVCAPSLPASALLRRVENPLIARYAAEADGAWAAARGAVGQIAGADAQLLLQSEFARPLVATMVSEMIVKQVQPRDCATIDRVLSLIEPLPPRNAAALIVTIARLSQRPGRVSPFTICADAPAR